MCPDALTSRADLDTIRTIYGHCQMCPHRGRRLWGPTNSKTGKPRPRPREILQCSPKTISRLAAQQKLQRGFRRVPGRKPLPVFHPGDIEAIRADTVQVKPFPVSERPEGTALARRPNQAAVDLIAQLFTDLDSSTSRGPCGAEDFPNADRSRRLQRPAESVAAAGHQEWETPGH